jgi:hypothetical protein
MTNPDYAGQDSAGRPIYVGSRVKFRRQIYTIKGFKPGQGRLGCAELILDRKPHLAEVSDEISVDLYGG